MIVVIAVIIVIAIVIAIVMYLYYKNKDKDNITDRRSYRLQNSTQEEIDRLEKAEALMRAYMDRFSCGDPTRNPTSGTHPGNFACGDDEKKVVEVFIEEENRSGYCCIETFGEQDPTKKEMVISMIKEMAREEIIEEMVDNTVDLGQYLTKQVKNRVAKYTKNRAAAKAAQYATSQGGTVVKNSAQRLLQKSLKLIMKKLKAVLKAIYMAVKAMMKAMAAAAKAAATTAKLAAGAACPPAGLVMVAFEVASFAMDAWDPNDYGNFVALDVLMNMRNAQIARFEQEWKNAGLSYPPYSQVFNPYADNPVPNVELYDTHVRERNKRERDARLLTNEWMSFSTYVNNWIDGEVDREMEQYGEGDYDVNDGQRRYKLRHPAYAPMLAEIEKEIRKEEPSFEGYEAFVTSTDPEVRCSDEAFDILEDATLFIAREQVERRLHRKYTEDGTDITDHDTYERTLLSELACKWFNLYEKPIFGYGGVFVEGIGCSLDQTGCMMEENRLSESRRKCLNSNEQECEEETAQWTDIYWKRHPIDPGSSRNPKVLPVRLPQKMCLTDQFRPDVDSCHGETREWDEGKGRYVHTDKAVKGQWNSTLKLCSYSADYCDKNALQKKLHRHNYGSEFSGEQLVVQTCVMLPGQEIMEMLFGQYAIRLFTSTLSAMNGLKNPKKAMRDWKSGKYPMGALLYYGMGVGVVANFANMVTNPGKYFKNKGLKWDKMRDGFVDLSIKVKRDFDKMGGTVEKFMAKITYMAGAQFIVGQIWDQVKIVANIADQVIYEIGDGVTELGRGFVKYVWEPTEDFFKGLF